MAINVNRVILVGRLGADPEAKGRDGDFVTMNVATSRRWKNGDGEQQEQTEWHKVVVFAKPSVTFAKNYLKKGDLVYVEGCLETRKWQDRDGADRYTTEVVVRPYDGTIQAQSSGSSGGGEDRGGGRQQERREPEPDRYSRDMDDEIPF